jgi:hypothetical protein
MTAHISKPVVEVHDSNGNPYVGAVMYIYTVNTTTLASIYSDKDLLVAMVNPLSGANASNARGEFPRVYVAAGQYKIRIETSAGVLIDQWDYTDTGLTFDGGALSVARGGTGGTTAATALENLGAAPQSAVDALSEDVADLSSSLQSITGQPGGRLTLTSATPVLAADVTAATSVYYTPFITDQVPIYNGTQFVMWTFAELTLTLAAEHVASNIYDVYLALNPGTETVVVGTGPAWTTATNLLGARGTGAGTTEIERQNGVWTNAVAITLRNGATTYSIDANEALFVGSIFMDGTNGQISCHSGVGTARKWGVSNAYNKKPITLRMRDATASWTYNSVTVRQSRATAANLATAFNCLPDDEVDAELQQTASVAYSSNTGDISVGIGWGVTNAYSGRVGFLRGSNAATSGETRGDLVGRYVAPPFIGIVNVASCENTPTSAATCTLYGGAQMQLTLRWLG